MNSLMAEGEGFEPPLPVRAKRFSRPPVSTTHTSLRVVGLRISGCLCRARFQVIKWLRHQGFERQMRRDHSQNAERVRVNSQDTRKTRWQRTVDWISVKESMLTGFPKAAWSRERLATKMCCLC